MEQNKYSASLQWWPCTQKQRNQPWMPGRTKTIHELGNSGKWNAENLPELFFLSVAFTKDSYFPNPTSKVISDHHSMQILQSQVTVRLILGAGTKSTALHSGWSRLPQSSPYQCPADICICPQIILCNFIYQPHEKAHQCFALFSAFWLDNQATRSLSVGTRVLQSSA